MLDASVIASITIPVVILTEIVKFYKMVPEGKALWVVLLLSSLGVGAWVSSQPDSYLSRQNVFEIFSGWAMVTAASAGVFGFIRSATPGAVTSTRKEE